MQSLPQSQCTEGEPASSPVFLSITLVSQAVCARQTSSHLPAPWVQLVWWRHPSDSNLHVGVIINGLYHLWVCSPCSLLPCVLSKHQFDVLQQIDLHISINTPFSFVCVCLCLFHGPGLALQYSLTKAGTVWVASSSSSAHLLAPHDDWISRWASCRHKAKQLWQAGSLIPFWLVIFSMHVQTESRRLRESKASDCASVPYNPPTLSRANLSLKLQIPSLGLLCTVVPDRLHSVKWSNSEGHTFIVSS